MGRMFQTITCLLVAQKSKTPLTLELAEKEQASRGQLWQSLHSRIKGDKGEGSSMEGGTRSGERRELGAGQSWGISGS